MNGAVLKFMRNNLNLSQTELAEKVGVSLLTIWRYEHGKQQPQPKQLRRLQEVLGYSEEDLYNITELLEDESKRRKHAQLKMKLQKQANL